MTDELVDVLVGSDVVIPEVHFLTGEVTDVSVSPPLIQVGASDTPVPCPTLYQPAAGDFVIVLVAGASRICIGPTKPRGWQHIFSDVFTGVSTVDVAIPVGIYHMIQIRIDAIGSALNTLSARVNNDSTAALHEYTSAFTLADATVTSVNQATQWNIGTVGVEPSLTVLEIVGTGASTTNRFTSYSTKYASTEANARTGQFGGQLASARSLSSVRLLPSAGTMTGRYVVTGYILP